MRKPIYINPIVKKILTLLCVELIPAVLGLIFSLIFENFVILETAFALFGVILLLFAVARNWNRDSNNYKANKTIVEDKKTESYKEYKKFQRTLWILGLVNIAISYLVFLIFVK